MKETIKQLMNTNEQERNEKDKMKKTIERLEKQNKESTDLIGVLEKKIIDLEVENNNLQKENRELASSLEEITIENKKAKQDDLRMEEEKTLQEEFIKCKNFVSGRYHFAEGKVKLISREIKRQCLRVFIYIIVLIMRSSTSLQTSQSSFLKASNPSMSINLVYRYVKLLTRSQ